MCHIGAKSHFNPFYYVKLNADSEKMGLHFVKSSKNYSFTEKKGYSAPRLNGPRLNGHPA